MLLTHDDVLNPNLDRMSRGTMTTSQVEILFQIFLERPISSHNDQKIGKYIATNLRSYNKVHVEFLIRWQRRGGQDGCFAIQLSHRLKFRIIKLLFSSLYKLLPCNSQYFLFQCTHYGIMQYYETPYKSNVNNTTTC